jgi:hypothetical protein
MEDLNKFIDEYSIAFISVFSVVAFFVLFRFIITMFKTIYNNFTKYGNDYRRRS